MSLVPIQQNEKTQRLLIRNQYGDIGGQDEAHGWVPLHSHTHNDKHGLITLQSVLKQHPPPLRDFYSLSHLIL